MVCRYVYHINIVKAGSTIPYGEIVIDLRFICIVLAIAIATFTSIAITVCMISRVAAKLYVGIGSRRTQ